MSEIEVKIEGLAALGSGVGHVDNKAIFVEGGCPGDFVRAKIIKNKKKYSITELAEVLEPSEFRVKPECKYFGKCGGCQWQHVDYKQQLKEKANILKGNLQHIGGFNCDDIETIGTDNGYNYRIKTRLQIGENGVIGFFAKGSKEIVEIDSCCILDKTLDEMRAKVCQHLKPVLKKAGVTRGSIEIGYSPVEKEAAMHIITDVFISDSALKELWQSDEKFCGYVSGEKGKKIRHGKTRLKLAEDNNGLTNYHGIDNFWQTNFELNTKVKLLLGDIIKQITDSSEKDELSALELFSGSGNYTQSIAQHFAEITAIESDKMACNSLVKNMKPVQHKIRTIAKTAGEGIAEFNQKGIDFLFLDPPRSGFFKGMTRIAELAPEWIVYLSCDNATLSRDLKVLLESGYEMQKTYCLDFFPQTFHIETLCVLRHI